MRHWILGLLLLGPVAEATSGDALVAALREHCGKAYAGEIVANEPADPADPFVGKALIAHVRECGEKQLRIPFHVGEDRSRTFVLDQLEDGWRLKHDHRHADGAPDVLTWYGGTARAGASGLRVEFPADAESKALFEQKGRPASVHNVWALAVEDQAFIYELTRPGRVFRVRFDLTRPIDPPPPPWGAD